MARPAGHIAPAAKAATAELTKEERVAKVEAWERALRAKRDSARASMPSTGKKKPLKYEGVGGGWSRVTSGTNNIHSGIDTRSVYYWHAATCKKLWTAPSMAQIQEGKAALKKPALSKGSPRPPPKLVEPPNQRSVFKTRESRYTLTPRDAAAGYHGPKAVDAALAQQGAAPGPEPEAKADAAGCEPGTPRLVVPLQLPGLPQTPRESPLSAGLHFATAARLAQLAILPDTDVKPRLPHTPIPRQSRSRRGLRQSAEAEIAAEELRQMRMERQRKEEIQTYKAAFAFIDADHSGEVDPPEVLKVLKHIGKQVDEKHFWEAFRDLDFDNSNSLDYGEFEVVMDTFTQKRMDALTQKRGNNAGVSPVRANCYASEVLLST